VAFSLIGDVVYASGSFYEQSVERRIFKPLGMNDASLGLAGIQASSRWARPHVRSRNGWVSLTRSRPTTALPRPPASTPAPATWRSGCWPTPGIAPTCCRHRCWPRCTP
jgi:beta-lactamase class C